MTSATAHDRRWLVLAVLASTLLLIAMDATVLNVALPSLAADLDPGATELLWIVDAYGLALAGLLVAMGGLGDRLGRRRLLVFGLAVFAGASVLAALATTPAQLIAARVLLGVGGAMAMPSTLSIVRNLFVDPRERTTAIGLLSAMASGGFAVGPIVGGAILEVAPWGWVFAINVPIALGALVLVRRWAPESRNPEPGPWDATAVGLSVAGMLALVWGIKHLGEHGLDAAGPVALLAAALLLRSFVRRQAATPTPILDVRLFADRRFSTAAAAVLFVFFGLGAVLLLLTQFLQLVQGLTPLESGLRVLPMAIAAAATSVVADRLVRVLGAHLAVGGAFAAMAAGLGVLTALDADSPYAVPAIAFVLLGGGAGLAAAAGSATIMGLAPAERAGGAAAVQETAFELGGALGVAILGSLMNAIYRGTDGLPDVAREGLPAAAEAARAGLPVLEAAQAAFMDGLAVTMVAATVVTGLAAVVAACVLPRREQGRPRTT
jgi:MFS transporter, DHA2 family, multidrug resistance protein